MRPPSRPVLCAFGAGAVALALLAARATPVVADGDHARDLLFARDCVELGRCALRAAPTTLAGVWQGSLWIGLVALGRALRLSLAAQQALVVASEALAVALVAHRLARLAGVRAAAVGALALTALLLPLEDAGLFWNPSPLGLPSALAVVALVRLAETGRARFAAVAGLAAGVAAAAHPVGLLLAPALALVPVLAARRRALALALGLTAAAAPLALTTGPALVAGMRRLELVGPRGLALTAALGGALAAAVALRPRFARLSAAGRALVPSLVTIAAALAGLAWLSLGARHSVATYYAAPALPAAALALGQAGGWLLERAPLRPAHPALALAALLLVSRDARRRSTHFDARFRLDDAPVVAARVLAGGARWDDVRLAIEGPRCDAAARMLSVAAPAPAGDPNEAGPARPWILLRLPAADAGRALAAGLETRSLPGGAIAALRPLASALDRDAARACFAGGVGPEGCVPVLPDPSEHIGPERFLFERRDYPEAWVHEHGGAYRLSYEVPLRARAGAVRLDLFVPAPARCGWQVARVEGAGDPGPLPATTVVLAPGDGGRLVLAREVDPARCPDEPDDHLPPCLLESAPEDAALRALAEVAP